MSASVNTSRGDRAAIQSELLMAETTRWEQGRVNFSRLMSSNIKKTVTSKKTKMQSDAISPVVRITDLGKGKGYGDHVVMDVKHRLVGLPRMGNADARGYEDELHTSRYEVSIDVHRYPVKAGSKLDQQRRSWSLDAEVRSSIADWAIRYKNEQFMYHAMGARGTYKDSDLILPLADFNGPEGNFNSFMVNPLSPATHNRAFFCGPVGTTTNCISAPVAGFTSGKPAVPMTGANAFSIASVYRLQRVLEEMVNPPPKARFEVKTPNGGYKKTSPMYVLLVTPRMWEEMRNQPGFNDYSQLVANALKRCSGWDHPLFINDMLMAGDILVCKTPIPVRHHQQATVQMRNDDDNGTPHIQQVPVGIDVDQGLLIGGQMLAYANGSTMSGYNWDMESEKYDYNYKKGYSIGCMFGMKKVTFRDRLGKLYDHGCITVYAATTPSS